MAKLFANLCNRAQGKLHVENICNKVFDQLKDNGTDVMKADKLQLATLLVYNSVNKQLFSPHKEPPHMADVQKAAEDYKTGTIGRKEFEDLIMKWLTKDLRIVLTNRAVLAFIAAPALAMVTKKATKNVPHVGKAVEKVPTPLLLSIFSVGLILLQDLRLG